jgi:hypothetical protein
MISSTVGGSGGFLRPCCPATRIRGRSMSSPATGGARHDQATVWNPWRPPLDDG